MKKICKQCGKYFIKPVNESIWAWNYRHHFCSKKCKNDYQKGKIPHDKGFKKGFTPWNKNKKGEYCLPPLSIEHKKKLSISKMGKLNPSWCGGMSKPQPYTTDWTDTLKRSIRERDHYTCRVCGKQQGETTFSVHHIDYNKENCSPTNLITLCPNCHSKTNHNRNTWIDFFTNKSTVA